MIVQIVVQSPNFLATPLLINGYNLFMFEQVASCLQRGPANLALQLRPLSLPKGTLPLSCKVVQDGLIFTAEAIAEVTLQGSYTSMKSKAAFFVYVSHFEAVYRKIIGHVGRHTQKAHLPTTRAQDGTQSFNLYNLAKCYTSAHFYVILFCLSGRGGDGNLFAQVNRNLCKESCWVSVAK